MITDLQSCLAATPEEVVNWCKKKYPELGPVFYSGRFAAKLEIHDPSIVLPVFAFRMRDKADDGKQFDDINPQFNMFMKVCKSAKNPQIPIMDLFTVWWTLHSKPIHWIAAGHLALNGGEWK